MNADTLLDTIRAHPKYVNLYGQQLAPEHEFWRLVYITDEANGFAQDVAIDIRYSEYGNRDSDSYVTNLPACFIPQGQFLTDLIAKIEAIKDAQDIIFYTISDVDETQERGLITVRVLNSDPSLHLEKKDYGAYRKADDSIDFIPSE